MLGFYSAFTLLASLSPQLQAATAANNIPALTIAIDQPAYAGQPIWVRAVDGPRQNIRYPFNAAAGYIGCNRLEVRHNGLLLERRPMRGVHGSSGILCGSGAPQGSPKYRLPLHILYQLNSPGTYSLRWTVETPHLLPSVKPEAQSDWLTFEVLEETPEQREAWIKNLLGNPPEDDGHLAGDFLPSLIAAAPDPRALAVFVKYMYAENRMVSAIAASALEEFPQPQVLRVVAESLEKHGPSDQLAYFAGYHTGWTNEDQDKIVHTTILYLHPEASTLPERKQLPSYALTQTSAAIKLLRFIFSVHNHTWPANPELASYADAQVLQAAPNIMSRPDVSAVQELALYLGAMKYSSRAHELLLQIAERSDDAGEQARIALTWRGQAIDLSHLAAVLVAPGDADPRGTDRSSLPDALVKGYGDDALPYLENAVLKSPYVWVRVQSGEQLALHQRPVGFQFLLDAIEGNQPYKAEVINWIKQNFSVPFGIDANERQIASFLRDKIHPSS